MPQDDLILRQMDVKAAYLNGPIDCEIYMRSLKDLKDVLTKLLASYASHCRERGSREAKSKERMGRLIDVE